MENKDFAEKMVKLSLGNRWIKGNYDRVYVNTIKLTELAGLEYDTYKTGNISSASFNGEHISNGKAKTIVNALAMAKFYYDVTEGKFHWMSDRDIDSGIYTKIVDSIKTQVNAQ